MYRSATRWWLELRFQVRPIVVEEGSHSDSLEQAWEALGKYFPGQADLSTELSPARRRPYGRVT